ncbi:hypothetical protein QWY28_22370, partial [Nocardioides sp. SOB77]|nr:hypothetical protein [Nocardioides oceani]
RSSTAIRVAHSRSSSGYFLDAAMTLILHGLRASTRPGAIHVGIVLGAIVLGGTALYLSRSQVLVDDESYMEAMIPHHSIAILTSGDC